MEWFEGNVNEALNNYQQKQGIMIVYVYDDDENSHKFDEIWKAFSGPPSYVAIRLLKDSEGAQQFAQFFPTLTIPVCYILGLNAQPLEVITSLQELTLEKLNDSFTRALLLYNEQLKEQGISIPAENKEEVILDRSIATQDTETATQADETEATKGMTKEEKVEYYRKLIEEKKKMDAKKAEEEERRKEIQRRNEGKALAEMREKQREKELRESAEARRKQKEEDAAALKRIRDQLKLDKEGRAKRSKGEVLEEPRAEKPAEAINQPVHTDDCRIQCRFPDGSTLNLVFPSKEPLQVVQDAVNMDSRKPANFFLVQPYPRRKLTEMDKSLLDHGLTPSSVILVIAAENGGKPHSIVSTGYLGMLLGFVYFPFAAIYRFFMSFTNFPGTPTRIDQQSNQSSSGNTNKEENKSAETVKDGNIQRFQADHEDDHSDNEATWNGNSTQQL